MAKRVDNDSTMEVSASQLVSGGQKRPAPHQAPGVSKNDVSMWIGNVVGADEFTGVGKKKPAKRRGLVVVLAVLAVAAVAGGVGYVLLGRSSGPSPSPSVAPLPGGTGSAAVVPAAVVPVVDAGAPPIDAAEPADAAAAAGTDGATVKADAISGADVKPKATPKKKTTKKVVKKPAVKKKPTSHHK